MHNNIRLPSMTLGQIKNNIPKYTSTYFWLKLITLCIVADLLIAGIWFSYILSTKKDMNGENFEVAIIFMGDFNSSYTALGKQTLRRVNFALNLYKSGTVSSLLCVGGSRPRQNLYGAELMKKYLLQNGVAEEYIFTETQSFDSKSNWSNSLKIIEKQKRRSICLISSPLHLHRLNKIISNPTKHLKIFPLPFSYTAAKPKITSVELWKYIHHEWIAYFLYALPEPVYSLILAVLRPQN